MKYDSKVLIEDLRTYWGDSPGVVDVRRFGDGDLLQLAENYVHKVNNLSPVINNWKVSDFPDYLLMFAGIGLELAKRTGKANNHFLRVASEHHDKHINELKCAVSVEEKYSVTESTDDWFNELFAELEF